MTRERPLVLIADDERNAVILLTRIFERDGFDVESARDGEAALVKARELHPDLILMDVQMPHMNGFEVTERLRETPETARIPVIFVTAAAREPSDVAHGFQLGADDYVRKPYNYHELLARARSKMRARQLEDRLKRRNDELEALVRIGGEFNQQIDLNELTALILAIVREELAGSRAQIVFFDETETPLRLVDSEVGEWDITTALDFLNNPESLIGMTWLTRAPALRDSVPDSAVYPVETSSPVSYSTLVTPLHHHGQLLGILVVAKNIEGFFGETDLRLLRSIGEQAALAIRNAQLYASLRGYVDNLESMVDKRTQELRLAQDQLVRSEKLAALGRLAAGVAHEVNNPLQPILNCLEVAIEDIESDEPIDVEVLRVAETEVQRIKSIVSRLLDFARPRTTEKALVDLNNLLTEVLALTNKQFERMRVNTITGFQNVPEVMGDAAQLKQVFLNLALNAAESMPEGGDLHIETVCEDSGVNVIITDNGEGMDESVIAQIFEPFYSTKGEGTGLGLAVSYGIIQGHGGDIHVESQKGSGSRFTVWLPIDHPFQIQTV